MLQGFPCADGEVGGGFRLLVAKPPIETVKSNWRKSPGRSWISPRMSRRVPAAKKRVIRNGSTTAIECASTATSTFRSAGAGSSNTTATSPEP
jgi:hypothetical protein